MQRSVVGGNSPGNAAGFDVAHRRLAEEAAVLAIELAGAFVAHFEGGAGGVEAVVQHAFTRHVQAKLLLILKGAHGGERAKVVMQRGYTHLRHGSEIFNAERLGVIHAQPGDGLGGAMALLAQRGNGAQMIALRTAEQAKDDFALNEAAEERYVAGRVEKIKEPRACVENFDRCDADGHTDGFGRFLRWRKFLLAEDAADIGHVELEVEAKHRARGRSRDHLTDDGQIEGREEE